MHLALNPIWSWPFALLLAAALAGLVAWTYPARLAGLGKVWRRLLMGLRMALVLMALFAMLRPALVFSEIKKQSASLIILVDRSRSMLIRDEANNRSRWESLVEVLTHPKTDAALKALAEDLEIITYAFDRDLSELVHLNDAPDGEQSAIGAALDEVLRKNAAKRIAGVVLLTDGAQRAAYPRDLPPLSMAARLRDLQVPLYGVGFGTEVPAEQARDLAMRNLSAGPTVFVKQKMVVRGEVIQRGFAHEPIGVKLLFETRPGEMNVVDAITLNSADADGALRVELAYVPQLPGEYKVTLEVTPKPGELVETNNSISTFVTVLKGGVNVLYLDALRFESKFIRIALDGAPDIQVQWRGLRGRLEGGPDEDRRTWFVPGRFDVFILGDVDADLFAPAELTALRDAVDQGAGLVMIGGYHSFGPGGYAETSLADVLPIAMDRLERQLGDTPRDDRHWPAPVSMLPTDRGEAHYVMRLGSQATNREVWQSLPPLEGANRFDKLAPLAQVLAETPDGAPLLAAIDGGQLRTLAFAGDTTYLWRMHGKADEHMQFWRQVVLWLARKEEATEGRVWVRLDRRRFAAGQKVAIIAGVETAEGERIDGAEYQVQIEGPDQRDDAVQMHQIAGEIHGSYFRTDVPGDYRVRVTATKDGKMLGSDQARFLVYEQDLEMDNPAADLSLLQSLAMQTEGKYLAPEEFIDFLNQLRHEPLNLEIEKYREVRLWDRWPFFLLFVVLLTTEWVIRKRRGLV